MVFLSHNKIKTFVFTDKLLIIVTTYIVQALSEDIICGFFKTPNLGKYFLYSSKWFYEKLQFCVKHDIIILYNLAYYLIVYYSINVDLANS